MKMQGVSVRFTAGMHARLRLLAKKQGLSMNELVRRACEAEYAKVELRKNSAEARIRQALP